MNVWGNGRRRCPRRTRTLISSCWTSSSPPSGRWLTTWANPPRRPQGKVHKRRGYLPRERVCCGGRGEGTCQPERTHQGVRRDRYSSPQFTAASSRVHKRRGLPPPGAGLLWGEKVVLWRGGGGGGLVHELTVRATVGLQATWTASRSSWRSWRARRATCTRRSLTAWTCWCNRTRCAPQSLCVPLHEVALRVPPDLSSPPTKLHIHVRAPVLFAQYRTFVLSAWLCVLARARVYTYGRKRWWERLAGLCALERTCVCRECVRDNALARVRFRFEPFLCVSVRAC